MTKITSDEISFFESMFNQENNIALMRAQFDGEDVAVIVRFRELSESVEASPIAVLINEEIFGRLTPPIDPYEGMEVEDGEVAN